MCSDKQLEYVKKLAIWKSAGIDLDEVATWDGTRVSELIDELKRMPSKKGKPAMPQEVKPSVEINPVRFGLALKLVINERGVSDVLANQKHAIELAIGLHNWMAKAEAQVSAGKPGVSA